MTFAKACFCQQREILFDAHAGFEDSIDQFFCPSCIDRAPDEAFVVRAEEPQELAGYYAINPNQAVLEEVDETFSDKSYYYERMWGLRKLSLKNAPSSFWGMVRALEIDQSSLSGPDMMIVDEEMPSSLPKKIQAGPKESGRPFQS